MTLSPSSTSLEGETPVAGARSLPGSGTRVRGCESRAEAEPVMIPVYSATSGGVVDYPQPAQVPGRESPADSA